MTDARVSADVLEVLLQASSPAARTAAAALEVLRQATNPAAQVSAVMLEVLWKPPVLANGRWGLPARIS